MSKEQVLGVVRHVLTFGSGFLIAKGWLDESAALEAVTAIVGLVGVIWSFTSKRQLPQG